MAQKLSAEAAARALTWGTSLSYLCAFASNYQQTSGLQDIDGIIPVRLPRAQRPLLIRLFRRADIGISTTCLCGMVISIAGVISRRYRSSGTMAALWYLYTTLQPDDPPLLQDVGFIAALLAPLSAHANNAELRAAVLNSGLGCARWLLFLVLFESGTGKLLGGSEQWWQQTAMFHHYQSQPSPTPGAWIVHRMFPAWLHRYTVR
jgi:hypothetical protein